MHAAAQASIDSYFISWNCQLVLHIKVLPLCNKSSSVEIEQSCVRMMLNISHIRLECASHMWKKNVSMCSCPCTYICVFCVCVCVYGRVCIWLWKPVLRYRIEYGEKGFYLSRCHSWWMPLIRQAQSGIISHLSSHSLHFLSIILYSLSPTLGGPHTHPFFPLWHW